MGYRDHVTSAEMSLRFYVKIQGLPYIFISGETPIAQDGTPWAAPTGYTLKPNTFDAADVQDIGCNISRIDGSASPGSMLIRLIEDRGYTLGELFAWDKTNGNIANLEADFPYETGAGPWTLTVDDTSTFDSSGTLYLGRETMTYSSKTSTTFTIDARTQFDPVGYGDTVYRHNSNLPSAPRIVADHPRVFIGRYVQVFAHWVHADGYALDTGFDGANSFECFRGIIRELPRPGEDWHSVEFEIEAIDAILRTEVGTESRQGRLYSYQNPLATDLIPEAALPPDFIYMVTAATERIEVQVEQSGSLVVDATGEDAYSIHGAFTVPPTAKAYTQWQLQYQFDLQLNAVTTATSGDLLICAGALADSWYIKIVNYSSTDSFTVTIYCDGVNSFFPMWGMTGTYQATILPNTNQNVLTGTKIASVIPAAATTIPFFYEADSDLLTSMDPVSPGYAVIGKDEESEIVSYESIASVSDETIAGLYQLEGVSRGLMGTTARAHVLTLEDAKSENEGAEIRFGIGVINDAFLESLLKLAISTGDGDHGTYDTFAVGTGAPQPPGHFDVDSFLAASATLTPTERTVSYFLSKPEALSAIAKDWLTPTGRFIFPRVDASGAYTIGIGRNKPPIPSQSVATLTTSAMHWSNPATYQRGRDTIVTGVTVYPVWDFAEESSNEEVRVSVINKDAEAEFGLRNVIEWKLRGYQISPGQALELTKNWAAQLAERHGRGRVVLEVTTDRSAWFINVGDTVALTVPSIPTPDGGRGLSTRYGVVENIVKIYSGAEPGAILRVVVESSNYADAYRPYAPSAKVISKSGSDITLAANEYSESGADVDYFAVGDEVVIHNEGDYSTFERKTIQAISGNVVTLDSALSLTVGSYTAMDYDTYILVQDSQADGAAFIASGGDFSDGDPAHRYV